MIFSSPEHKVLKVSFSDRAMSVVHRACVRACVRQHLSCQRDRGHIFQPIITEIGVDMCLDKI